LFSYYHLEDLNQSDAQWNKDEQLEAAQVKSDVDHDLLALLAERILQVNKQKLKEIKGFLGWLSVTWRKASRFRSFGP
jgi:uncharacterized protein YegL